MMKNHWNTVKICLFGQTTKQWLSNFEALKSSSDILFTKNNFFDQFSIC